jgi:hypothetical protein
VHKRHDKPNPKGRPKGKAKANTKAESNLNVKANPNLNIYATAQEALEDTAGMGEDFEAMLKDIGDMSIDQGDMGNMSVDQGESLYDLTRSTSLMHLI